MLGKVSDVGVERGGAAVHFVSADGHELGWNTVGRRAGKNSITHQHEQVGLAMSWAEAADLIHASCHHSEFVEEQGIFHMSRRPAKIS